MTLLRGSGNSPDYALYGGSPQAVQDFYNAKHDGCLTVAILMRSPKTEGDPDFVPCFEVRYHNGDCLPGGYKEYPGTPSEVDFAELTAQVQAKCEELAALQAEFEAKCAEVIANAEAVQGNADAIAAKCEEIAALQVTLTEKCEQIDDLQAQLDALSPDTAYVLDVGNSVTVDNGDGTFTTTVPQVLASDGSPSPFPPFVYTTSEPDTDVSAASIVFDPITGTLTLAVTEDGTTLGNPVSCIMPQVKGVFDSAGEQIPWPDIKTTGLQEFERRCCARFRQVVSLTDGLVRTVVSPFNPATGSGVFKWTDPVTGWSAELAVTGAGSYNGPSGTTTNQTFTQMTDGTVDLSVVDAGDKLARTGYPHQIRRQQLIVADLDIGEATLTNSIGTVTNIGDFTEAPPGTFVTNPANDDSNLRFTDTNQPGGLLGTLSLVNVQLNQGDNWTVGVNLNYYPAAVIFKDCNGDIIRAEDENGNEVDPALVEEVV